MKVAEQQENLYAQLYAAADMSADTDTRAPLAGDATVGKWTLISLYGLLALLEVVTIAQDKSSTSSWVRIGLSIMLARAVYKGARWARYFTLFSLGLGFCLLAFVLVWSRGRGLDPFIVFLAAYNATFFYFLKFSRNVRAFLDAQRGVA